MSEPTDDEANEDGGARGAASRRGSAATGDRDGEERTSLGILFIAAALGLALFLAIVGLIAYAAMSRSPGTLSRGAATWFDARPWQISVLT